MRTLQTLKKDLMRAVGMAVLSLMLVPVVTLAFCMYVNSTWDGMFLERMEQQLSTGAQPNAAEAQIRAFYQSNPPSTACALPSGGADDYRSAFCDTFGQGWQFYWTRQVSAATLAASVVLLLAIGGLGLMALRNRDAQYRSLMISWRLLAFSGAAAVVVQGAMLVWLSFWVTAHFFEVFFIKLVIVAGIFVGLAISIAIKAIIARIPDTMPLDGEFVLEADAPALWARIRALAAQIGTAPPDNIIAGIDANFFVTESELQVEGKIVRGRSLYVSLPLLRVLDQSEADAVLAHELAHLQGGDTRSSAALGPALSRFDRYLGEMAATFLTRTAFYSLLLYRTIFEIGLKRDSRQREFMADTAAAGCVGGRPLVTSLIKVAAYSSYRAKIEQQLFEHTGRHGEQIGISAFVAEGLKPFANSEEFGSIMETASVPHPFDSHPLLGERMQNVGVQIGDAEFGEVIAAPLAHSWASEILTAEQVEARLWTAYETRFAQMHEHNLAYRYLPEGEAETSIVKKYFPDQTFDMNKEKVMTVTHDGISLPDEEFISWDTVKNIEYESAFGGGVLTLTLTEKGVFGDKSKKIKVSGEKEQRDQVVATYGQYWHRHKVARSQA